MQIKMLAIDRSGDSAIQITAYICDQPNEFVTKSEVSNRQENEGKRTGSK